MEIKHPNYYKEIKKKRQEEARSRSRSSDKGHRTDDTPAPGSVYRLTGSRSQPSIANGNTWKESQVLEEDNG